MSKLPDAITDASILQTSKVEKFVQSWPQRWRTIQKLNQIVPASGPLRRWFRHAVFERPWSRWHRFAYVPQYRDVFFEYILTFFYRYPIAAGDTVLQFGASNGEETARFARAVGAQGKVIAVEPAPDNIAQLESAFPQDGTSQVIVVPKAAAKSEGKLKFFLGQPKEGRIAEIPAEKLSYEWWGVEDHLDPERYTGEVQVDAQTPEDIISPLDVNIIDFVLVETNGTESDVVEALEPLLSRIRRIGARGHVRRDGVPIYKSIEAFLASNGFETHLTDEEMVLGENTRLID